MHHLVLETVEVSIFVCKKWRSSACQAVTEMSRKLKDWFLFEFHFFTVTEEHYLEVK
jgi:hypothetical protein